MILWEEGSLNDREKIFEFLYDFNLMRQRKLTTSLKQK